MSVKIVFDDFDQLYKRYLAGEPPEQVSGGYRGPFIRECHRRGLHVRGKSEFMRLRMSRPGEGLRATKAAHEAVRGVRRKLSELLKRADTREKIPPAMSTQELKFAAQLHKRGLSFTFQKACGKYNIDFTIGPIAVEVFGGAWHGQLRHARRHPKRVRHLFEAGFHQVIIWAPRRNQQTWVLALNEIVSLLELTRRNPSMVRQYWVIYGDNQHIIRRDAKAKDFPLKPTFIGTRDAKGRYQFKPR